jgi:RNA polymerase sigma-70 factor (ECF subfamily)
LSVRATAEERSAVRVTSPLPAKNALEDLSWIDAFRRGDREILAQCYCAYYRVLEAAIGGVLGVADRETVIHEVFLRLLTERDVRESFTGLTGRSLGAWLSTMARNRALDVRRRARREVRLSMPVEVPHPNLDARAGENTMMRLLLERFQREHVPPAWALVFETRFLGDMSQREAARQLGMRRTTLAYQELQLRRRLRQFMLEADGP